MKTHNHRCTVLAALTPLLIFGCGIESTSDLTSDPLTGVNAANDANSVGGSSGTPPTGQAGSMTTPNAQSGGAQGAMEGSSGASTANIGTGGTSSADSANSEMNSGGSSGAAVELPETESSKQPEDMNDDELAAGGTQMMADPNNSIPEESVDTETPEDTDGMDQQEIPGEVLPVESEGCGASMTPPRCEPCQANGLDYYVDLPDNYDPTRPYPVVFQYHPLGGSGQQARTMYNVRPNFPDAIYVSPDGSDNGFPNTGGVDEAATREIIESIESTLCIDKERYFATGFSYGGSMSYTAGFCIADVFRAIAPMAGATISGANNCDPARPVAAWINHGDMDTALPISMSITLRDRLLETNGCSQDTVPVEPSPCMAYQGCQEGSPVIWCEQPGVGHAIPMYGATTIAEFFQQF